MKDNVYSLSRLLPKSRAMRSRDVYRILRQLTIYNDAYMAHNQRSWFVFNTNWVENDESFMGLVYFLVPKHQGVGIKGLSSPKAIPFIWRKARESNPSLRNSSGRR